MTRRLRNLGYGATLAAILVMLVSSGGTLQAQQEPAPGQLLSPDQLDYLVAPIALYPDPLISQILVATTYPLEIVEASQWLQRNPNMKGAALSQAALNQDWDPSIQALVVFPDVLKYLTEDISWTTNLGNAFLAQEGDVMDAIQRMRDRAAQSGKLKSTAEQQVIQTYDAGQPVYEIIPTNPTVIYVPVYDPFYIWGSPIYYPYPRWYYPPHVSHYYFSSGIYIDAYFGSSWYGSGYYGPSYRVWNNWGWRPAWNTHTVVVNNVFIDNHNFRSNQPRNVTATAAWSHDATHRRGVVYPTSSSYDRYRRDPRDAPRPQQVQSQGRSLPAQSIARNAGTSNAPRPVDSWNDRSGGRPDIRQDSRQDAGRQDVRTDTRQDSRIATAGAANFPNRDSRDNSGQADSRSGNRNVNVGSNNAGSNRPVSSPSQVASAFPTHVTPAQVTLSRPVTQAPDISQLRGASQAQPGGYRDSQAGRNVGTSITRAPSATPRDNTPSRSSSPSTIQSAPSRQSFPGREAAPTVRSAPAQQSRSTSVASSMPQQSNARQSAPSNGNSSAGRSAPSQQSAPPSNSQGNGRSSNSGSNGSSGGGSNGGGHSRGGR